MRKTVLTYVLLSILLSACANFHKVTPELYRSAQPTGVDVARWYANFGIQTVINLRGRHPEWPVDEAVVAVCKYYGIEYHAIRMSASRAPTDAEVNTLVDAFRLAPKPLLVYCKSGCDRTGFAVAVYLVVMDNWEVEDAVATALSIRYGHIEWAHPELKRWFLEREEDLEVGF